MRKQEFSYPHLISNVMVISVAQINKKNRFHGAVIEKILVIGLTIRACVAAST